VQSFWPCRHRVAVTTVCNCGRRCNVASSSKRNQTLGTLGSCASGAVGGRCSAHLGGSRSATKGIRRVHEKTHACNSFQIKKCLVTAGGLGIFRRIENTECTGFVSRPKRSTTPTL